MSDNMRPLFEASRLKVGRAQQHIRELADVLQRHAAENPPEFQFTEASEGENARINFTTKSPPMVVGAIVGDHTLIANAANMTTPQVTVDTSQFPKLSIKPVEGSVGSVQIVFPTDSPLAGSEMVPSLHELVQLIEGVLKAFAGMVAARA